MKWLLGLLLASVVWAGDEPRLFLSKSFPGSVPPYSQITVDKDGNVEYREATDDDQPLKYRLTEGDTHEVFGLAEKLDYFKHPLESAAKVAFMGTKTFRYENGGTTSETKFNYSEDPSARLLLDWFERMVESAARRIDLERSAKYDHLGIVKSVLLLQFSIENKRVVAPEQFLPLLDRISKNEIYMHTARERAAELADAIRKSLP
jgi:hypothetical protein